MQGKVNKQVRYVDGRRVYWFRFPLTGVMIPIFVEERRRWSAARKRRFTRTLQILGIVASGPIWALVQELMK
ncbi:hypothetical protein [Catellatospora vulcania]|uniref:hypothetical protein n=1 Tax=Catellatospora vulcania TaxID=1460450 RepID=UPI0012D40A4C|nr:hypothetical protein [Catellatospora vulcania]